jgi:hypothetical protein
VARKRFTDTEKWNDTWFRGLPPKIKCAWSYLCDTCDNAGIWKIDLEGMSFNVGEKIRPDEFEKYFSGRFKKISDDKIWILKFIDFQAGKIKMGNKPHEQIIGILKEHDLIDSYKAITRVNKGLGEGTETLQDKKRIRKGLEKEKDKKNAAENFVRKVEGKWPEEA